MDKIARMISGKSGKVDEETDDEMPHVEEAPAAAAPKKPAAEDKPAPKKAKAVIAVKKGGVVKKATEKKERPAADTRTAMQRISNSNFAKHAILAGVLRIQDKKRVFNRCKYLTMEIVEEVMTPAKALMLHCDKKTLTCDMIVHIAASKGHKLYWSPDEKPAQKKKAAGTKAVEAE